MMLYFKCTCGEEHREIAPMDKRGYTELPNGRFRFNPDAPVLEELEHSHTCSVCHHRTKATPDPKAVRSFVKFDTFDYQ
jgi:hypothetical protein